MRTLVVGGAGFIGSHLVDALIDGGEDVLVVDNLFLGKKENVNPKAEFVWMDVFTTPDRLDFLFDHREIETVFNLAVLPLPHSLIYPHNNFKVNVGIVENLCRCLQEGKYKRLIHFSSSEVYGSAQYEPMCEKHPIEPSTPYAASKAAGDFFCLSYVKTFGCDITIIRPFNNYGPRQNAGSYAGVIPITIERVLSGKVPLIYGNGEQTRDYIYVADTARAAVMIKQARENNKIKKGEVINIGSGHDIKIGWLIREIARWITKTDVPIQMEPARPGDVMRHLSNCLKAKDLIGFQHQIGMKEGLEKTVNWLINDFWRKEDSK